jgi:hypothetical protein
LYIKDGEGRDNVRDRNSTKTLKTSVNDFSVSTRIDNELRKVQVDTNLLWPPEEHL